MKVLVVDDHPLIREALRNVLAELDAKCELLESADSAGALGMAASHADIDLVLLDLNLPDSEGFTTLQELRRRRPATAVVVCSAQHDHQLVARARLGAETVDPALDRQATAGLERGRAGRADPRSGRRGHHSGAPVDLAA